MSEYETRTQIVEPGLADRLARETVKWNYRRGPGRWIPWWVLVPFAVVVAIAIPVLTPEMWFLALALWTILGVYALVGLFLYVVMRRHVRASSPVGTTISARVGDDVLTTSSAHDESSVKLSAIRDVWISPKAVIIRLFSGLSLLILPRELFTEDDLERLQAGTRVA